MSARHRQPVVERRQVNAWTPVAGTAGNDDSCTVEVTIDVLRQPTERTVELAIGKLQLIDGVQEEPSWRFLIRFPRFESRLIDRREDVDRRFAIKGLKWEEEGEPAFFDQALYLFFHFPRLPGARLSQQDNPCVLQQIYPTKCWAKPMFVQKRKLLGVSEFRVGQIAKSPL